MFEDSTLEKHWRKLTALAAVALIAWYAISASEQRAKEKAMVSEALHQLDNSLPSLEHLEKTATAGMATQVTNTQEQQDQIREERAAEKAANAPKAYRWKAADGQWHLSDHAPDGTAEVIPLERMK